MSQTNRVSKEQLSAGYQTAVTGWVVHTDDTLQLGKGSMPDKRFAFIYESLTSFNYANSANSPNAYDRRNYLNSNMSGQRVRVKELLQYGTKRTGYTMIAKVGVGNIVNYWIEIDNAVEAGEILPPERYRTAKKSEAISTSGSVADELKKLKELMDAGVITKEEFEAQKKKLLN
ncbi:SHOCT domain-containing protein [Spirosoma aureum]|uniref:SHOCT domain-containing protein n=2 Tax=Spirosoma aureum TaxID=2692134 RepID=A0A6G9B007_9BACT|nr:SHOCT domain-containing protein [Spirosoma aureum]